MINNTSYIKKYNSLQSINEELSIDDSFMIISLDGSELKTKNSFIRIFYDQIFAPLTFWLNWAAFEDTIRDQEFWITKKLVLIIKNKNALFVTSEESQDRLYLDSILIDLIQLEGYYIYLAS